MMADNYLAFDLGADSGRAIVGSLDNNRRLQIEEIHRFPNQPVNEAGTLTWNIAALWQEMLAACRLLTGEGSLRSIGIDTWGVDFGLLDQQGNLINRPFTYRNPATTSTASMTDFFKKMPREDLYHRTGIQILPYNSVFQLYALMNGHYISPDKAADLLFMPDLLNYFLTGNKLTEFTIATTSQMYNPLSRVWDMDILNNVGISPKIMQRIVQPGTVIGNTTPALREQTGLRDIPVVAVASHDTGSAIAAVPAPDDDFVYISCGTWSLMGILSPEPLINEKTLKYNITNEGGICNTFRVLKNITGLWILQRSYREWAQVNEYTYGELVAMAGAAEECDSIIDPDSPEFFNPPAMIAAIDAFCRGTGQAVPDSIGQYVKVILRSLALAHRYTLDQLKEVCRKDIKRIHIIGGGSQNPLLCQYTANATGLPVSAGPIEATAIGNILVQAMTAKKVTDLNQIRAIVRNSFPCQSYKPAKTGLWDLFYIRYKQLK